MYSLPKIIFQKVLAKILTIFLLNIQRKQSIDPVRRPMHEAMIPRGSVSEDPENTKAEPSPPNTTT